MGIFHSHQEITPTACLAIIPLILYYLYLWILLSHHHIFKKSVFLSFFQRNHHHSTKKKNITPRLFDMVSKLGLVLFLIFILNNYMKKEVWRLLLSSMICLQSADHNCISSKRSCKQYVFYTKQCNLLGTDWSSGYRQTLKAVTHSGFILSLLLALNTELVFASVCLVDELWITTLVCSPERMCPNAWLRIFIAGTLETQRQIK